MNIQLERTHIIEQINQINDINLIKAIKSMLTFASTKEKTSSFVIPEWHKKIIDQRMDDLKKNPDNVIDFDKTCDEIEKEL